MATLPVGLNGQRHNVIVTHAEGAALRIHVNRPGNVRALIVGCVVRSQLSLYSLGQMRRSCW